MVNGSRALPPTPSRCGCRIVSATGFGASAWLSLFSPASRLSSRAFNPRSPDGRPVVLLGPLQHDMREREFVQCCPVGFPVIRCNVGCMDMAVVAANLKRLQDRTRPQSARAECACTSLVVARWTHRAGGDERARGGHHPARFGVRRGADGYRPVHWRCWCPNLPGPKTEGERLFIAARPGASAGLRRRSG